MDCDPRVQDLASVTTDTILVLFGQFQGFVTHGRSSAKQSSNFVEGHDQGRHPANSGLCRILYPTRMTDRSPEYAERKTAKKQVQFWAKSREKLPSGCYRRLA